MAPRHVLLGWNSDTYNAVCVDGSTSNIWRNIADKYTFWDGEERLNNYSLKLIITEMDGTSVSGVTVLTAPNDEWFDFIFAYNSSPIDVTDIYQIVPKGVSTFTITNGNQVTFFVDGLEYGKTVLYGPSDPTGENPVTITSKGGQILTLGKGTKKMAEGEGDPVTANVYGLYTERNIHTSTATTDKGNYVDNVNAVLWLIKEVE
jgi:hypothetical protein